MRDRSPYLGGVVDLPRLKNPSDRRAVWRQTLALLARTGEGPGPLEGLHPDALLAAVRVALSDKLIDDTEWLAEPAAGAALYEIAAVVPPSAEQRELGRRVAAKLLQGSAETFTSIATRMALGTGKGLSAAHVRARIALVTELPLSLGVPDGPMCLAFVSRRQVARDLIVQPSAGSLPSRRTASRIFERAAREAARRAQQGDEHAMRAFVAEGVSQSFERLLSDREPLVWRHAAAARGMLAPWIPSMRKAIEQGVDTSLSPTEWRRAATSIAAMMSVDLGSSQKLVKPWMSGPFTKDAGGAAALVWGLGRAAETEPEAASALLDDLAARAPLAIAQAVTELGADFGTAGPFEQAIEAVARAIREHKAEDDGAAAAQRETLRDLDRIPRASAPDAEPREDDPIDVQVAHALAAFATHGAREAYTRASRAFESVHGLLDALEGLTDGPQSSGAASRRTSLTVLRQLDASLLERSTLVDLMSLAPSPETAKAHVQAALLARERIASWVLDRFREREDEDKTDAPVRDPTLRLMRLRAMLHLVDSDVSDDDGSRATELRKRWSRIASVLLHRMATGLPPVLRRANAATLARTLDALVRAEAIDPADALLAISRRVRDAGEMRVLAEASMDPSLRHALSHYADLIVAVSGADDASKRDSLIPRVPLAAELAALDAWTRDGLLDPSNRAETLRTVVVRLQQSVAAIAQANALSDLAADGARDVGAAFESSLGSLAQLSGGARSRLDTESGAVITSSELVLAVGVARVLSGAEPSLSESVIEGVRSIAREVPPAFEIVATRALDVLAKLPAHDANKRAGAAPIKESLPPWLPARRTLGGFYVVRPLASGGGGSVLVAVRIEDRQEENAERFALKVPSYDASAARTVSESEFFEMFRAEASALLAIPAHPNLARFVTFDTGSKPKPILVMELVEGQNLDHEIASRALDSKRALKALDDVLAGLDAMHGVDVGHLDLKPSNVVLRQGRDAVLVDFGLAGRRIRPGCATGPYGAPEVWGADLVTAQASPRTADVYAFGCVAFEAMTGDTLFRAESELQQIAIHLAHRRLSGQAPQARAKTRAQPFAEFLFSTLRRDAEQTADRGASTRRAQEARAESFVGEVAARVTRSDFTARRRKDLRSRWPTSSFASCIGTRDRSAARTRRSCSFDRAPSTRFPGAGARPDIPGCFRTRIATCRSGRRRS